MTVEKQCLKKLKRQGQGVATTKSKPPGPVNKNERKNHQKLTILHLITHRVYSQWAMYRCCRIYLKTCIAILGRYREQWN